MSEQQAKQDSEFSINPYGAMQLMVENGCELEGLGPHHNVDRFQWCKVAGTFQIKVPDGWDQIGVAVILRRKFRIPEKKKPRVWTCNKFPAQATYDISCPGIRKGFAVLIECNDPPKYVSYVITEVL